MPVIDQFEAISENGRIYTIIVNEGVIDVSTHDGPNETIPGMKSARTLEGFTVTKHKNDKFLIIETGDIVQRIE